MTAIKLKEPNESKEGRSMTSKKKIKHKEFAQRLEQACDGNPHVPDPNYGRLRWVAEELEQKFGKSVSLESVRKWFAGESRPRDYDLSKVAEIFNVDEAWLATGLTPDRSPKARKLRGAMVDGAVNVLAGAIQMDGGHPAFPTEDETDVDLHAIIRGARYSFRVCLARDNSDPVTFHVPGNNQTNIVIGVVRRGGFRFDFYELDDDALATGENRGGYIVVAPDLAQLRQIVSFKDRI